MSRTDVRGQTRVMPGQQQGACRQPHFGVVLRRIRERHDVSLYAIADALGLSHGWLRRVEAGSESISRATAERILTVLPELRREELSIYRLLAGIPTPAPERELTPAERLMLRIQANATERQAIARELLDPESDRWMRRRGLAERYGELEREAEMLWDQYRRAAAREGRRV